MLAYRRDGATSALHAQHWWFSGKIGRCQKESFFTGRLPLISASPGFDSRPMHVTAHSSIYPFALCIPSSPRQRWTGQARECGIDFFFPTGLLLRNGDAGWLDIVYFDLCP